MDADRALLRRLNSLLPRVRRQAAREAASLDVEHLWTLISTEVEDSNRRIKIRAMFWRITGFAWALPVPLGYVLQKVIGTQYSQPPIPYMLFVIFCIFGCPVFSILATILLRSRRAMLELMRVIEEAGDVRLIAAPLAALYPKLRAEHGLRTPYSIRGSRLDRAVCATLRKLLPGVTPEMASNLAEDHCRTLNVILVEPSFDPELSLHAIRVLAYGGDTASLSLVERIANSKPQSRAMKPVHVAAVEYLPRLRARIAELSRPYTLLRPAEAPGANELLRPAGNAAHRADEPLLRPVVSEE